MGHGIFNGSIGNPCSGERTGGCLEIVRIAQAAIDSLIIV